MPSRVYDPIAKLRSNFKTRYGLSLSDFETLSALQNNLCHTCNLPETRTDKNGNTRRLNLDHHHKSGRIRKLLCSNCNTALGLAKESPALLRKLADYLEHHSQPISI